MKNLTNSPYRSLFLLLFSILLLTSCERDLTNDAEFATFATTAEIFTDSPIGLGSDFYFPFGGSKATAWSVDNDVSYLGSSSMRFDVPNANDPNGNYAGAIFRVDGSGRNLTGYNALTFWAKASQGVSIDELGFGQDFDENKFMVSANGLSIGTTWAKYIIPIPDPSKLTQERGMLWYAAGTQGTGGLGYTFWLDEVRFENLGTIGQASPAIMNGIDVVEDTFNGVSAEVIGLTHTVNLGSGGNQTINVAPSYFTFNSSDPNVAMVNELGEVSVLAAGSTQITGILAGVAAQGSLTLNSIGDFSSAPSPTLNASDVISIFSDAYTNVPVDFYNGFYAPFQTTTSNDFSVGGDNILNYQNYNFVGIEFNQNVPTIDATGKTMMHFDIFIPDALDSAATLRFNVVDFGADQSFGGGDDTSVALSLNTGTSPALVTGQWIGVDMNITGLANQNNLGQIVFDADTNTGPRPSGFYVDNIYIY